MALPVFRYSFITKPSLFPAILLQGGEIVLCKKLLLLLLSPHLYAEPCTLVLDLKSSTSWIGGGERGPGRPPQNPLAFLYCLTAYWHEIVVHSTFCNS